jgi:hypothetical protein
LLLMAASEWLLPGWVGQFLRVVRAYRRYTFGHSLLDVWFSSGAGPYAAIGLVSVVCVLVWPYRRNAADSPGYLISVCLCLAATLVVIPTLAPHAQLLLLPGFLCLLRFRKESRSARPWVRLLLTAPWLLITWPWLAAIGLTLAALKMPPSTLFKWWELPLYSSPVLPFAVVVALGCLIRMQSPPRGQGFEIHSVTTDEMESSREETAG